MSFAVENIKTFGLKEEFYKHALYRPFDQKYTYFTNKSKGFIAYPVYDIMRHLVHKEEKKNLGLIVGQCGNVVGDMEWNLGFVTNSIVDLNVFYRGGGYVYPLYVETKKETEYGNTTSTDFGTDSIISNFKEETMLKVIQNLGERPSNEDLFDYIYAILNSPNYRKRYSEFLKRDFPHIPYPTSTDRFDKMVEKGRMLRNLHLMQGKEEWEAHKKYPCVGEGTGIVEYRRWDM